MITFKKGFYITYNVGTYSIKDNGNGGKYIVSNEYSSVFNKEPKIQTRMQFFNNPHNSLNMLTEYANVDVSKAESVIKYCNKYGPSCFIVIFGYKVQRGLSRRLYSKS